MENMEPGYEPRLSNLDSELCFYPSNRAYSSSTTLSSSFLKSGAGSRKAPRWQFALRPGADGSAVIVGQRLVAACFLLGLDHVLCAEQLPFVPQVLVKLLCSVRQDGSQDRLQVVHDT